MSASCFHVQTCVYMCHNMFKCVHFFVLKFSISTAICTDMASPRIKAGETMGAGDDSLRAEMVGFPKILARNSDLETIYLKYNERKTSYD